MPKRSHNQIHNLQPKTKTKNDHMSDTARRARRALLSFNQAPRSPLQDLLIRDESDEDDHSKFAN